MAEESFADGTLRVAYPDAFGAPIELPQGLPGARSTGPGEPAVNDPTELIVAALGEQQFTLVRQLGLAPEPPAASTRSAPHESATWTVDLEVASDESAVILVDHDGVVSWQLPTSRTAPLGPVTRGRRDAPSTTVSFELTVGGTEPATRGGARAAGLLGVIGRVRAYFLKFVAAAVADGAMKVLERDVKSGLVVITSRDPRQWQSVSTLADVVLPSDRPARILLMVHGTFSSTLGSFAGLAATSEGGEFLDGAIRTYDAVIGFDHPTLSCDPKENANDLLDRLQAVQLFAPPTIDVVCYSRGGLVARSLIEYLLPSAEWRAHPGRVVFVGATNGGTSIVDPDNWNEFLDLYTNLAMAATRAIGLIMGSLPIAEIARGVIDGAGAFAKYLVAYAVDGGGVPGLSAMEPDGDFVRELNETQSDQPGPGTSWFVVSSDFEASLANDGHALRDLPARLVQILVDGLADQLFDTPNDLVVDTASMSAIAPHVGGFVADSLPFGANGRVHHLAYFVQPAVAHALMGWLVTERGSGVVPPGSVVTVGLPWAAQRGIAVVDTDALVADLRLKIEHRPSWVVLRNTGGSFIQGDFGFGVLSAAHSQITDGEFTGTTDHPFDLQSIQNTIDGVQGDVALSEVFMVGDGEAAPTIDIFDPVPIGIRIAEDLTPHNIVITDGGAPVAVLPQTTPPLSIQDIADRQSRSPEPPSRGPDPEPPDRDGSTVQAHLTARMPDRVQLRAAVSVECTLSRQGAFVHVVGQQAFFAAALERDVVIQLIPTRNAEVVGEGMVSLPMPKADEVVPIVFEFTPTHEGSCEVWVAARQGAEPLVSLILTAVVEEQLSGVTTTPSAEASVPIGTCGEGERPQYLSIWEMQNGNEVRYKYDLVDDTLKISASGESPVLGDRAGFINGIYQQLEAARFDNQEDAKNFLENVQDIGSGLFTRLFPVTVQSALWSNQKSLKRLVVRSTEPFIPWELVHLKDPNKLNRPEDPLFLGQLGLVRWLPTVGYPPTKLRKGRVRALCARYGNRYTPTLQEMDKEEAFLKERLQAVDVPPTESDLRELLRKGDFDIFHFAGHGLATKGAMIIQLGDVEQAKDKFKPIMYTDTNVRENADLDKDRTGGPLVFLNACQVGQATIELGTMGGFAQAFLGGGAAAFVSTLWSVGDKLARTFGQEFYEKLLAGETVSEAVRLAREKGRKSGDISWLAYIVYAHPAAKFEA